MCASSLLYPDPPSTLQEERGLHGRSGFATISVQEVKKLCVEWGRTNTGWPINVNYVKKFLHTREVWTMELWECLGQAKYIYSFASATSSSFSNLGAGGRYNNTLRN